MIGQEILTDIDETLDKLIKNAEAMNGASYNELTRQEVDAFQKTQESLLAHLIHMDQKLEKEHRTLKVPNKKSANATIQEKLLQFEKINGSFVRNTAKSFQVIQFKKQKRAKTRKRTRSFSRLKSQ